MNKIYYFDGITDIEEAKKLFRDLVKLHHPDLGGNAEVFKDIKKQFDNYINNFANFTFKNDGKDYSSEDIADFKDILSKIIHFDDVTISIIGRWIYVFNSFKVKDELKALGFWFASSKKAWVFNGVGKTVRKGRYTLDDVKSKHGCINVKTTPNASKIAFLGKKHSKNALIVKRM